MAINTAGLSGWPSPELLNAGAGAINSTGPQLEAAVAGVSAQWNGLQAHYQAPEAETVLGVFSNIVPHGEFVRSASEQAAKALEDFAAGIAVLQGIREVLLADIAAHNSFVNSAACTEEDAADAAFATALLQGRVDRLVEQILQLEQDCVSALESAGGESNPFLAFATSFPGAITMGAIEELVGAVDDQLRPLWPGGPQAYFDFRPEKNKLLLAVSDRYRQFTVNNPDRFAPSQSFFQANGLGKSVKIGGGALSVAGGYFTFQSQQEQEYNRLLQSNPEMSEADRRARANEVAGFRTATSVGAGVGAGYIGATIGSFGGPLGTAVGFVAGLAIGYALDHKFEFLGDRSLTEWAGDGLLAGWDWVRGPGMDYAKEAGEYLQDKGGELRDFAVETGGELRDFAAEKGAELRDYATETGEELRDFADDAAKEVDKRVDSAKKAADEAVDRAREGIGNLFGAFGR